MSKKEIEKIRSKKGFISDINGVGDIPG